MGAYNIVNPASLAAGQPEDVSVVLANLQAIQAILNGGIDNTNVAPGAAIPYSKLALALGIVNADVSNVAAIAPAKVAFSAYPFVNADVAAAAALAVSKLAAGANGQFLSTVAGVPTWVAGAGAGLIDSAVTDLAATTVAAASVYAPVIPGGTIGTNGLVIVEFEGDLGTVTNNQTYTISIRFGGTTWIQFSTPVITSRATRQPILIRVLISGRNATNAQRIAATVYYTNLAAGADPTTGIGSGSAGVVGVLGQSANTNIDSTVNQTFDIQSALTTAGANNDLTRRFAHTHKVI